MINDYPEGPRDKDPVVVLCNTSNRSMTAARERINRLLVNVIIMEKILIYPFRYFIILLEESY